MCIRDSINRSRQREVGSAKAHVLSQKAVLAGVRVGDDTLGAGATKPAQLFEADRSRACGAISSPPVAQVSALATPPCGLRLDSEASALARNYHTLLAKSDPPIRLKTADLAHGKDRSRLSRWLGVQRICGIHRACAPPARMKSPDSSLAHGQGLFFVWVTLSEHKWVILRECRG